jgi:hypothetical protein
VITGAGSPFATLWRMFFGQFFASESVTSELYLRRAMIATLAFILVPAVILLVALFPTFQITVLTARYRHRPELVEEMLIYIGFILIAYAMVTTGAIGAFLWDALIFDRRDAMVLLPMPVRRRTIVAAKLAAVGAFIVGAALAVNLLNAIMFALTTADLGTIGTFLRHFTGELIASMAAAVFVGAAMVVLRAIAMAGGPRLAAMFGSLLQLAFISTFLCVIVVVLGAKSTGLPFAGSPAAGWLPPLWFVGLFERLVGAHSGSFDSYAARAAAGTSAAVAAALAISVVACQRQLRGAVTSGGGQDLPGSARFLQLMAAPFVRGNPGAKGIADFVLLTLMRSPAQRMPVIVTTAIAVSLIATAVTPALWSPLRPPTTLASLMQPRPAVLWVPLVLTYWIAVGLRASFYMPSELAAAWTFRTNGGERLAAAPFLGTRAAMMAVVEPAAILSSVAVTALLLGWWIAALHTMFVAAVATLWVELSALTIRHIPFTQAYAPGHARLKTRWWWYVVGTFVFAYLPVKFELTLFGRPLTLAGVSGVMAALAVALDVWGRRRSNAPGPPAVEDDDAVTTLDLAGAATLT